jgi:hypothetical protein
MTGTSSGVCRWEGRWPTQAVAAPWLRSQSDLRRLPDRATIVNLESFRAALLDVVALELRLNPDPVVLPSPSVSTTDPADRHLTGTPPQPHFGLRPANPRFLRCARQQYYKCDHCSLHNSIAIATIVG